MKMVKKVVHYLKNAIYLSLIYGGYFKDKGKTKTLITSFLFGLIEYKDNSYARDLKDKKFVIRYYYFINRAVVSWYSKKQRIVSIFTIKAKYIILGPKA